MIVCLLLMTHFNCIHCQAAGLLQEVSEIGMEVFGFHDLHDFQDQKRLHGFAMEKRRGVKLGVFWRMVFGGCETVDWHGGNMKLEMS